MDRFVVPEPSAEAVEAAFDSLGQIDPLYTGRCAAPDECGLCQVCSKRYAQVVLNKDVPPLCGPRWSGR